MSVSPNVVIMTKAELLDYRDEWFDKGVQRGRFEERCDQSQAKADVEAVTGQTSEVTEESVSRPVDGRSSTATSERMDVTGGESAALNSSAHNHQLHAVSQGWRDIETAPRDGTHVFVCDQSDPSFPFSQRPPTVAHWFGPPDLPGLRAGGWYLSVSYNEQPKLHGLTHWMPLPAPPSPAKTGGAE